jgi:hypothetical protein
VDDVFVRWVTANVLRQFAEGPAARLLLSPAEHQRSTTTGWSP